MEDVIDFAKKKNDVQICHHHQQRKNGWRERWERLKIFDMLYGVHENIVAGFFASITYSGVKHYVHVTPLGEQSFPNAWAWALN